jgi:predicted transcriptional regulator YheO
MAKKYLRQLTPLVDAIAETFGKNCEVVLHDLSTPEKSIIKIANGHLTGRSLGGPITDLGLRLFREARDGNGSDCLIGYRTKSKKGADLKSTTVFIRNGKSEIVGCLCINIDITPYLSLSNVIEQMCETPTYADDAGLVEAHDSPEKFESSVDGLIKDLIEKTLKKAGKPTAYMEKEDKLQIIRELKESGLFLIKGSAKKASDALNVSLSTIYKYLEEI